MTGGAGYIGSHACKALFTAGYLPVTYDNLSQGHPWAVQWGPLVQGELSDRGRLREVIAEHQPMAVLHFAARLAVGESVSDPARYYGNNVVGTLDLLEVIRECNVSRIVFSSTAAVYGDPIHVPIREDHPTAPTNPYGMTKLAVEGILQDYARAYGLSSISLRYFNAAGADPDADIGEAHEPETHLIPLVLEAALGNHATLKIYGDDYDTPDGTCVRDYVHVSGLAEAHVLALQSLEAITAPSAQHYNLGNGSGFSVLQVINAAEPVTGVIISRTVVGRRAGDPPTLVADSTLAFDRLNWRPRYSELETQISHAWAWYSAQQRK